MSFQKTTHIRLLKTLTFKQSLNLTIETKNKVILIKTFMAKKYSAQLKKKIKRIATSAIDLLLAHHWPGNVRELENCVEYATVLAGDNRIMSEHLPLSMVQASKDPISSLAVDLPTHKELEKRYTKLVLEHTGNNKTEACKILGVSITTLWRRLKE